MADWVQCTGRGTKVPFFLNLDAAVKISPADHGSLITILASEGGEEKSLVEYAVEEAPNDLVVARKVRG